MKFEADKYGEFIYIVGDGLKIPVLQSAGLEQLSKINGEKEAMIIQSKFLAAIANILNSFEEENDVGKRKSAAAPKGQRKSPERKLGKSIPKEDKKMSNPTPQPSVGHCPVNLKFGIDWLGCSECGACDYFEECSNEFAQINLEEDLDER